MDIEIKDKVVITQAEYDALINNQRKKRGRKHTRTERYDLMNFRLPLSFIEKFKKAADIQHANYTALFRRLCTSTRTLDYLSSQIDTEWTVDKSFYKRSNIEDNGGN